MHWLEQKVFWTYFENQYDGLKINYDDWFYFETSEDSLRELIGDYEPNTDLRDEDDPPGPMKRWYGNLNEIPVLLDFDIRHSSVTIYFGVIDGAIEQVRNAFKSWGDEWQESKVI